MENIDWIIVAVGVVALVATTAGVLYEEDLVGATDITFVEDSREFTIPTSSNFATSTELTAPAGMNATGADLSVVVSFTGQAQAPQGTASITVRVVAPDGETDDSDTRTMTFANAAGGGGAQPVTFTFTDLNFGAVPTNTSTEEPGSFDANMTWEGGYTIQVTVSPPADPFTNGVGAAQATYTFTAGATVTERFFQHVVDTPDIEGGA